MTHPTGDLLRRESDKYYDNAGNAALLEILPPLEGAKVLDLGCGSGANASAMQSAGARVFGVTISLAEASRASARMRGAVVADLARSIPFSDQSGFDLVVLSHVIEHIPDPVALLRRTRDLLGPGGRTAVAVPSISHYSVRTRLMRGDWTYAETGIFDWTHLRFFNRCGILAVFQRADYEVQREEHEGAFPLWRLRSLLTKTAVNAINRRAVKLWPELFATQFVFLLTPK